MQWSKARVNKTVNPILISENEKIIDQGKSMYEILIINYQIIRNKLYTLENVTFTFLVIDGRVNCLEFPS